MPGVDARLTTRAEAGLFPGQAGARVAVGKGQPTTAAEPQS